jgi:hypothetical protein
VNVSGENGKVGLLIDQNAFVSSLKKMPRTLVAVIEVSRIADVETPHEFTEVSKGSFNQKMKMVVHQDIAVEFYGINIHGLDKSLQKGFSIDVVPEDGLLFIATAGDVIYGIRILHPKRSCHNTKLAFSYINVNKEELTPLLSLMLPFCLGI